MYRYYLCVLCVMVWECERKRWKWKRRQPNGPGPLQPLFLLLIFLFCCLFVFSFPHESLTPFAVNRYRIYYIAKRKEKRVSQRYIYIYMYGQRAFLYIAKLLFLFLTPSHRTKRLYEKNSFSERPKATCEIFLATFIYLFFFFPLFILCYRIFFFFFLYEFWFMWIISIGHCIDVGKVFHN